MAWRIVGISNPAQLSVKDNQLVIKQNKLISLPIEDINALILDSYGVTTTTTLITSLSGFGVTVIICDEKHLPASVILPYSQHSRQAKISRQQIAMGQALRKQLWRKIIIQKITNQADVLSQFNYNPAPLKKIAREVRSGDIDNRESIAARIYFANLLDDATRRKPTWYNSAFNYGYAMVRSHIARCVASRGLIASHGIFHRSELNSFNLADDFIEAYRPAVDQYILTQVAPLRIGEIDSNLSKEDRQNIIDILNYSVIIKNKKYTIKHAVDRTVESFVQAIEEDSADSLVLPQIIRG